MKILNANAGALTNFEVLDFLRSRGAVGDSTRLVPNTAPSELKVYDYLVESPACNQTREVINDFLEKCRPFNLAKAEVLNIMNTRPSDLVYIYPIVELCDDRLGDRIEELKQTILEVLPPPPVPPTPPEEEGTKEGEDTANDQNNGEDKDETAQRNQMELS
ncbi:DNA-directed RNA polymerase III subunit RPC9-like [Tripterygium wilfordii]|uniref:DNA-directed RNA polymerase III subunit RPC9 n=1 Tax=Tripterygium wilfordii TaxID=458696 RepID=A0A7J7D6T2_TRIWF|nr:DNA-directed RNA polymerase III subunit RPC9-like [Tripterygium wilfordii]KAF5742003.1 DNA-directed RNA polymerase III subunit RPC9-like [Tripterygium wilfordii]